MNNFRIEPFLWIHLVGLAIAPLLLVVVWIGLAVGDPWLFYRLELVLVGTVGVVPILWMQWTKPFDFFGLLFFALRPNSLTEEQRKILKLLKTRKNKIFHGFAAIGLLGVGWLLYQSAPIVTVTASMLPQWRILGLIIAAIAFLLCNLFIQVSISILGVLSTSDKTWSATEAISSDQVTKEFTVIGLRVSKIFLIPTLNPSSTVTEKTS
ncbi:low-complexity tail membrane protein [Crocosphaera sp. Alani8]|uniref:low-complexity tail membrane protein n=1 Tax=Crocosphaera sp. Alani8 TaxID=3038952 RepID=UPI00313AE43C